MFDRASRYAALPQLTLDIPGANGQVRHIRYVTRRFLPPIDGTTTLVEHRVVQGERVDHLAARYAGDPTLFWRICDANLIVRPDDLETVGRVVIVALPALGG